LSAFTNKTIANKPSKIVMRCDEYSIARAASAKFKQQIDFFHQQHQNTMSTDSTTMTTTTTTSSSTTEMHLDVPSATAISTATTASISNASASSALLDGLRKYFHYESFRYPQADAIAALQAGDDVLVRAATGSGKSLIYQLPAAMITDRSVVVVISPLIALMRDQTIALERRGIAACYLASDHSDGDTADKLLRGEYRLVYMSPERATAGVAFLEQLHASTRISLFAIDECHTLSEWGHDFRPAYRQLALLRARVPNVPIIALTATATVRTMSDVAVVLNMHAHRTRRFNASLERTNLRYAVFQKASIGDDVRALLMSGVIAVPTSLAASVPSVIMYCATRANVEACTCAHRTLWLT
jgi:RecQ family ATP-dependent DNA helicase